MTYSITAPQGPIRGTVKLPSSKSESNRVLIIQSLCGDKFEITNLSEAQDSRSLKEILEKDRQYNFGEVTYDVGAAGTTMRFLTALFANKPGTRILTGSERMKKRPIKILVDALRQIGADIAYMEEEGYPPLKIKGKELMGGEIEIDGSVSSQYISALLMIAPTLPKGLILKFKGDVASRPYINMTLKIMEHFGVGGIWHDDSISVSPQSYFIKDETKYTVEADWSSASYWYAIAALRRGSEIALEGLKKESMQGDAVLHDLYRFFGVNTEFLPNGIKLTTVEYKPERFGFDFNDSPDIAQTVGVTAAALNIPILCKGLHTLKLKETDRALALKKELAKIGVELEIISDDAAHIHPEKRNAQAQSSFATYEDHRMAMSFAALACVYPSVRIEHPEVVKKSYPGFWNDLKSVGFRIEN
ncbi:MAG: 3-phosphoshikimate 1-carboxyvinyltransferase [Bacteroidota bacterium]